MKNYVKMIELNWEKLVKKNFMALLMVLIMCMSVFTGCSLVGVNDERYYEAVVATITYADGEKENVTKRDLIMGYNSYGYNYVENYGYTAQEAVELTLDIIIDQRLTIKEVEDYYAANNLELLNDRETTYLWDQLYDSIYSNLKQYFNQVTGNSSSSSESDSSSSSSSNSSIYTPYVKNAKLEEVKQADGSTKLVIVKTQTPDTIRETYVARYQDGQPYNFEEQAFAEALYNKIMALTDVGSWKSALGDYLADVRSNYTYMDFESDKECLMFELERVYEILKDNYLVEKYEIIYNREAQQDSNYSNVTVDDVLKYYSARVRTDYVNYTANPDTFQTDILSDVGNVDYILEENNATNYFYVGYVKMAFTEEQTAKYEELQDLTYTTPGQQEKELQALYDSVKATVRDAETGEATGETVSAKTLLEEIQGKVDDIQYVEGEEDDIETARQKAEAFRKYMYLYNDDDTLKNADYNTVFGVTVDGEVLANDTFSSNEDALEAIKQLYNEGNAKIGDMTGLVKAEDGYYIFFYAGGIENLFYVDENFDVSRNRDAIRVLASTYINIFSDKTVFDVIYDELTTDNYSAFENMNIDYLRSQTQSIEAYTNNFKDLF